MISDVEYTKFSTKDCREVDELVRRNNRSYRKEALSEKELRELSMKLDSISEFYSIGGLSKSINTSSQRIELYEGVKLHSEALLKLLSVDEESISSGINLAHFYDNGMFDQNFTLANRFVEILPLMISLCEAGILSEDGEAKRGDIPDVDLHVLAGRVGYQYKMYWGGGKVPLGLNVHGEGGPGVRFMQWAIAKIINRPIQPRQVIYAYKRAPFTASNSLNLEHETTGRCLLKPKTADEPIACIDCLEIEHLFAL
ncbi:hypothetical protein [Qipengyuania flava]|uniref:hypothetical protein n=1 Tax=Qipengyuania flava TaxID=192812 RepID=UPI00141B0398|nr:hypothetical protein [Qipengyuania flava]NIJ61657.1 hypothetical protein [Qipengyuania flava]